MSDVHDKTTAVAIIERAPDQSLSPVVAGVMRSLGANPDPATLRELLSVQRDWEANEARKAFALALVGLKRDLPTVIARDKTVGFASTDPTKAKTSYTHASLGGVMEAITEPLTQHGFSLAWKPSTAPNGVTVNCRLTHAAGHYEECSLTAPIDNSGNKSTAQGIASTITLLQRYTALSLLGIATADMKDPEPDAPAADAVDSARNLRAVGLLTKKGKTCPEAESFLGRKVAEWTSSDLEKLQQWAKTPNPDNASTGETK